MKKALFSVAAATLSVSALTAQATDGTVDFQGKLVAQTCSIDINGVPSFSSAIMLPRVSTSTLTTAGQTTGRTGFTIGLSNCSGSAKSAAAFFESQANWFDPVSGNLTYRPTPGFASNVQMQLIDAMTDKPIRVGDIGQMTSTTQIPIDANGNAKLPYAVQYYATGVTTAGKAITSTWFSINYQ